ncbi:MAG TPA: metal ABC transporter permease [Atribacteraceae bacterium]|nr:metal ABC transporter permease [Atribacteraceae bacterium]
MTDLLNILQYTFMQRAILAGIVAGVMCSIVGVYVVLKRLSFMGAGISHSAFGGVALGYLLGIDPMFTAIGFCVLSALGISFFSRRKIVREDTVIGIFYSASMGLGVFLTGYLRGYNVDLFGYLFGNILAVTISDLKIMTGVLAIVVFLVIFYYKELLSIVLDDETAAVSGIPVAFLNHLLAGLVAITIVVSLRVVGIILVSALIVIPSAAAMHMTDNFKTLMALSVTIGVLSCLTGLFLSYLLNTPSGATIILTATLIFVIAALRTSLRRAH